MQAPKPEPPQPNARSNLKKEPNVDLPDKPSKAHVVIRVHTLNFAS